MCAFKISLVSLAVLLASASPAFAGGSTGFDVLYSLVPARADGLVAVDHQRLARHKSASKLRKFVHDQGGGLGLKALVTLGLVPGKDVLRSVSFNVGRSEAELLVGTFSLESLQATAKAKLGATFETGEQGGHAWFSVARGRRLVSVGKDLVVIGTAAMTKRVVERVAGKGKPVSKRTAFKAMLAPATKAKASLWGMAWVPKGVRRLLKGPAADALSTVTRTRFHAVGNGDMTLQGAVFTDSNKSAKALKGILETEINRVFGNSLTLKMLGVTGLVSNITFAVKRKTLTATLPLTAGQVDLVATSGGKIIKILRSQ